MRRTYKGTEFENAYYVYRTDNSLQKFLNRLPSVKTTYYKYDSNGNAIKIYDGTNSTYFQYGPHQLVTQIVAPGTNPWNFFYDGQLNRYKTDKAGTVSYYLWDGPNLLEERDSSGVLRAQYNHGYAQIPGIGSVVECKRITSTTTYFQYPLMDHRGTVYAVADSGQNTLLSYTQDAFGRQLSAVGGTFPNVPSEMIYQTNWRTPLIGSTYYGLSPSRVYDFLTGRFLGRDPLPNAHKLITSSKGNVLGIFDGTMFAATVLGLNIYYKNWYMSSGIGRFLSIDPTGHLEIDNLNLYTYVHDRTTNLIDPLGLRDGETICCAKKQANWVAQKFKNPSACAWALFKAIAGGAVQLGGGEGAIGGGYLGLSGTAGTTATTATAATAVGLIGAGFLAGAISAGISTYADCLGLCNEENCLAPCANRTMVPTFESGWWPWDEIKCGTEPACAPPCFWFTPKGGGR